MVIIFPRPFLLGVVNLPLTMDRQYFVRTIPTGASWRFKYLLVSYPLATELGVQIAANLSYKLYDADGRAFHINPVLLPMVTGPAGTGRSIAGTNRIEIDYPGGTNIKLELERVQAGTLPPTISITLYGIRGWEGYGR
jgi:hypothetical protein